MKNTKKNTNNRRYLAVIAIAAIIGLIFTACPDGDGPKGNTTKEPKYELINGLEYEVSIVTEDAANIVIASTYNGKPVTTIKQEGFKGSPITSVTIPNSVTTINYGAFMNCTGLTSVTIPNSVIILGIEAFKGCSNLASVTIPSNITFIDNGVFGSTGLTNVTIPSNITEIRQNAFLGTKLTSVTIPSSVSEIGVAAFHSCTELASLTISDGVETIGNGAFYYCTGLTSVTIPNSVTEIGDTAFGGCENLVSITFQRNDTVIGDYASPFVDLSNPNALRDVYQAVGGGAGTYTRPDNTSDVWTKQP
ncbi:MAG: leucine-rich repeat domain-containing protein [Treponema sp.]|nr:leucine-rich repeat domain-containing protein [Treponema sp.]